MIVKVDIEKLDLVVGHESEKWTERYKQLLLDEPLHPLFTSRLVGELKVYDLNESVDSYTNLTKRPDFGDHLNKVQTFHAALKSGYIDMLHITEMATRTYTGEVCMQAAFDGGVRIVEIPTDLGAGFGQTAGVSQ